MALLHHTSILKRIEPQSELFTFLYEFMLSRFGKQAALDLGCLGLDLEVTNATVDCLREKSILALLSMEIVNELMTQPCIGRIACHYGFNCLFS